MLFKLLQTPLPSQLGVPHDQAALMRMARFLRRLSSTESYNIGCHVILLWRRLLFDQNRCVGKY